MSTASLHFTATQLKQLDSLKNRVANIVQEKSLPKIVNLIRNKLVLLLKRCCSNLEGYFQLIDHVTQTRNNGFLLRLPKTRLEFGKKAFKFEGAKVYNSLPLYIRKENDVRKI